MCQGFGHLFAFLHHLVLAKLATTIIGVRTLAFKDNLMSFTNRWHVVIFPLEMNSK